MKPFKKIPQPPALTALASQRTLRVTMRDKIIDNLGFFCSYCEIPLGGYEVEHHKPFAQWLPLINANEWEDILLICKDCREHIVKPVLTPSDMESMLWPDTDITFTPDEYSPFIYKPKKVIYKVIDDEGIIKEEQHLELVFIKPNPKTEAAVQEKAQNTINHFQLNMRTEYYTAETETITVPHTAHCQMLDNRIFERTRAWQEANEAADRYIIMRDNLLAVNRPDILEAFKKQLTAHAYFKGNWSVWMTVFNERFRDPQLLKELFMSNNDYFGTINLG